MIPIVSLLTDFGWSDEYVASMKARMLSLLPDLRFIDISHDIPPQDVRAGAWLLGRAVPAFDKGTVHLAVVDPGVGTHRRAIAFAARGCHFVGPDNGLFDRILDDAHGAVELDPERVRLRQQAKVSATFHGRDLFAPAAARLAQGEALRDLGPPVTGLERLEWIAERNDSQLRSEVVWVDHFGNLITPIGEEDLRELGPELEIHVGGRDIGGLRDTYGEVESGEILPYVGSGGTLEIARRNGNLAGHLGVGRGETVIVRRAGA